MRRAARLMSAVTWLRRYGGKDIVRGYARWYALDLLCAITELRMLGVHIPAEREERARRSIADRVSERARRRARRLAAQRAPGFGDDGFFESDGDIEMT